MEGTHADASSIIGPGVPRVYDLRDETTALLVGQGETLTAAAVELAGQAVPGVAEFSGDEGDVLRRAVRCQVDVLLSSWAERRDVGAWERSRTRSRWAELSRLGIDLVGAMAIVEATGNVVWGAAGTAAATAAAEPSEVATTAVALMAQLSSEHVRAMRVVAADVATGFASAGDARRSRTGILEHLLAGDIDEQSALERALAIGYDLSRPHGLVLVGRVRSRATQSSLPNTVATVLRRLPEAVAAGESVTPDHQRVAIPVDNLADWPARTAVLADVLRDSGVLAVVAAPVEVSSLVQAYRASRHDLRIAIATGRRSGVVQWIDLLQERSLLALSFEEQRLVLAPMIALGNQEDREHLVHTIAALGEVEGNVRAAARRLGQHESTVSRHIRRIETLTCLSFQHADERRRLYSAALIFRLTQHPLFART